MLLSNKEKMYRNTIVLDERITDIELEYLFTRVSIAADVCLGIEMERAPTPAFAHFLFVVNESEYSVSVAHAPRFLAVSD